MAPVFTFVNSSRQNAYTVVDGGDPTAEVAYPYVEGGELTVEGGETVLRRSSLFTSTDSEYLEGASSDSSSANRC